jgi:hypothetical protein
VYQINAARHARTVAASNANRQSNGADIFLPTKQQSHFESIIMAAANVTPNRRGTINYYTCAGQLVSSLMDAAAKRTSGLYHGILSKMFGEPDINSYGYNQVYSGPSLKLSLTG